MKKFCLSYGLAATDDPTLIDGFVESVSPKAFASSQYFRGLPAQS